MIKKQIDINIIDKYKNTPFSLSIQSQSSSELVKFSENTKTILTEKKSVILPEILLGDFGLFASDILHSMMYLCYILNKYNTCIIPFQLEIPEKISWEKYKLANALEFIESSNVLLLEEFDINFYCLLPSIIFWKDKNLNFIVDNMHLYIKRSLNLNNKIRFLFIHLLIVLNNSSSHANMIIYDKEKNILIRFEPYGDWGISDSYFLDEFIIDLFKNCL